MKIKKFVIIASAFIFMAFFGSHPVNAIECLRAPLPPALDALTSDRVVDVSTVEVDSWDGTTPAPADDNIYYAFMPKKTVPTVGFIILPGGTATPGRTRRLPATLPQKGFLPALSPCRNALQYQGTREQTK